MSLPPPVLDPYRPSDAVVVRPTLPASAAVVLAERRIRERWTRPADGDLFTKIAAPSLVWVPYWRVAITLHGRMVTSYGEFDAPPAGATWVERHEDGFKRGGVAFKTFDGTKGYTMVCARKTARFGSYFATAEGSAPPWHVRSDEVVAREAAGDILGDDPCIVHADVFPGMVHDAARRLAIERISNSRSSAVTVWKAPKVEGVITHFVLVPHHWVAYEYRGEAAPRRSAGFFVAVHGRCEQIVSESHPSGLRAVAGRLRRLLSFDRSALR
jgi:hypothetical protein